jgi:glyceraldehyde 3-phosphate dehydrogenase
MAITVGINGGLVGSVGKSTKPSAIITTTKHVVAVNDIGNIKIMTHLLKYDTNHGRFPGESLPPTMAHR